MRPWTSTPLRFSTGPDGAAGRSTRGRLKPFSAWWPFRGRAVVLACPKPAPGLVAELMLTLLPLSVSAGPAELAGFPAVLVAPIGYTHEAGKLNARRRASVPTQDEVLSWDAEQLADAAGNWPPACLPPPGPCSSPTSLRRSAERRSSPTG